MSKKTAIILLNWNSKEDTKDCIKSLDKITGGNFKIILVDNGSTDGSPDYFKKNYPDIKIITNGHNLGYAGGNNVGITYALENNYDFVLLLNNDTTVNRNFLTYLVETAENDPKIGIIGPKIYYFNNPNKIWFSGGRINWKENDLPSLKHIGLNEIDRGQHNTRKCTDFITGCAILIKKEVIKKIGMLDPNFFLYNEDADWCIRAKIYDYKIIYEPKSIIYHKIMGSLKKSNMRHEYFVYRNRLLLVKKHQKIDERLRIYLKVMSKILKNYAKFLYAKNDFEKFIKSGEYLGYIDFFMNKNRYI